MIPNTSDWVCTHPLLYVPNGWWFLIVRSSTADRITADTCFVLLMRTACNRPLQRIIVHTSTCLCQKKTAHTATHHHCHALSTRDACPTCTILWNQIKSVGRKLFRHMPDQRGTTFVRLTPTPRTSTVSVS